MSNNSFLKSSKGKHFFFIVALGFITYLLIFINPPYFSVSDAPFWVKNVGFSYHRPLTLLVFKIINPVFKLNPLYYYFLGVSLHLFSAILIYFLIVRLAANNRVALITAAYFLIHYISADTLLGIYQFETIFSGALYLISILCFIKYRDGAKGGNIFYAVSLLVYLLALGARESVFSLPAIILAYDIIFAQDDGGRKFKGTVCRHAPYFIATIIIIATIGLNEWYTYRIPERLNVLQNNFSGVIINYAILMEALFIPFNFQYANNAFWQAVNHNLFISLLISLCFVLLFFTVKNKACKFALFWIAATTVPFLARPFQLKEVYLYLPLIGAGLFLSLLIQKAVDMIKNEPAVSLWRNFLALALLLPLFVSSWGRILDRQRLGEISKQILIIVNSSIISTSKNVLMYAFGFPYEIERFLIGSRSAKEIAPAFYWKNGVESGRGKTWVSIDCSATGGNAMEISEAMYALTLSKTAVNPLKNQRLSFGIPKYQMLDIPVKEINSRVIGLDAVFKHAYDRYVFYYLDGKTIDLTERIFPKSKIVFKVKGGKNRRLSIAGDFNGWDRQDYLLYNKEGFWEKKLLLAPGKYLYKIIIDGDKEVDISGLGYSVNDSSMGACAVLVISNNALPVGLLPSGDDNYDEQVIKVKEEILINPDDASLHKKLAGLYAQKGFVKEARLEDTAAKGLIKKDEISFNIPAF